MHTGYVNELAVAITEQRKLQGVTVKALAARFGVEQPTVSRWASGKSVPGDEHFADLATWLGRTEKEIAAMAHTPVDKVDLLTSQLDRVTKEVAALREVVAWLQAERDSR